MTVSILVVDVCTTNLVVEKLFCIHTAVENLVGCRDRYYYKGGAPITPLENKIQTFTSLTSVSS